jgi:hypothetical protein
LQPFVAERPKINQPLQDQLPRISCSRTNESDLDSLGQKKMCARLRSPTASAALSERGYNAPSYAADASIISMSR